MKTITIAFVVAALLLPIRAEEKAPETTNKIAVPNPTALSPAEVEKWNEINATLKAAFEAMEKAELDYLRKKDAHQKAQIDGGAVLVKMQTEAKCHGCVPVALPDGTLTWPKPKEAK